MIDTRALQQWLINTAFKYRVLIMHHPFDWLSEWSRAELEKAVASGMVLVLSGHVHRGAATFTSRGAGGSVHCVAPPLFTRKADLLGYSFITLETTDGSITVDYRQWTPTYNFVSGNSLSGNDTGKLTFPPYNATYIPVDVTG